MNNSSSPSLPDHAGEYLLSRLSVIQPYTAEEYFTVLLGRAIQASLTGDYGISAALVDRYQGVELVSLGRNTVISRSDPFGHAEANAIRHFRDFARLAPADRASEVVPWTDPLSVADSDHAMFIRPTSSTSAADGSVLYTTLEPCPMCTVAIMNSRVQTVVIATPDEPAGVLAPERLARLPEVWPHLAAQQHLRVRFAGPGSLNDPDTYIPDALSGLLRNAFLGTKDALDAEVSGGVLFKSGVQKELQDLLQAAFKLPDDGG